MKYLLALCFLIVGSTVTAQSATTPAVIPDFAVYDMATGKGFNQNNLSKSGKLVFIFYDPGCGYCQEKTEDIAKNIAGFDHATIYFISMVDKELIAEFRDKYASKIKDKPNVKFLYDVNYEFLDKFNPREYPTTLVYSASNKRLIKELSGNTGIKTILAVVNQ